MIPSLSAQSVGCPVSGSPSLYAAGSTLMAVKEIKHCSLLKVLYAAESTLMAVKEIKYCSLMNYYTQLTVL